MAVIRTLNDKYGYYSPEPGTGTGAYAPLDIITDNLRSLSGMSMDIRRIPDKVKAAVEAGAVLLFTGNAMEVLGQSVTDAEGRVWEGLGLAEFATVETRQRDPQDVIARPILWQETAVGFMNKCSRTTGVEHPLFSSLDMGFGNEAPGDAEGYCNESLLATHITGPVLAKNPAFTAWLVRKFFEDRGWQLPEQLPVYPHEEAAYQVTLRELSARLNRQAT